MNNKSLVTQGVKWFYYFEVLLKVLLKPYICDLSLGTTPPFCQDELVFFDSKNVLSLTGRSGQLVLQDHLSVITSLRNIIRSSQFHKTQVIMLLLDTPPLYPVWYRLGLEFTIGMNLFCNLPTCILKAHNASFMTYFSLYCCPITFSGHQPP